MADEEAESTFIEGFNKEGKSLERISKQKDLHELLKKTNLAKTARDKDVAEQQDLMQQLQNDLNHINEQCIKKTSELASLQKKQTVDLDANRKQALGEVMRGTLEDYLERRPTDPNDKRTVHVYFLTGEEVGSELHVGREGAGSRDATFIVTLSQTVQSLATQAAKYWGLDPNKVFFLDRDGRIVQGKMNLSDIILPPVEPTLDGTDAPAQEGSTAIVPATGSALAVPDGKKKGDEIVSYTMKGRDYSLTLVRAKTVLNKEDLSVPKGEKWNDFTFDPKRLNEDLEITRKKRGDPDPNEQKVGMENIPSLYDLIKQGNLRKFQKKADQWCRIMELVIFLVMWFMFCLLLKPDHVWALSANVAGEALRSDLMHFTLNEQADTGIQNFSQISDPSQLTHWFNGPLKRSVLSTGDTHGSLKHRNLFALKVQVRVFNTPMNEALELNWCADGGNGTNGSSADIVNNTNASSAETCYPTSLKQCPNKAVVEMFTYAISKEQHVPECKPFYNENIFFATWRSLCSVDSFSFISGEVSSYLGGKAYDVNISGSDDYDISLVDLLPKALVAEQPPAQLVNVFTYMPTQEAIHVMQFLIEFSPGGSVITTFKDHVINLDPSDDWEVAFFLAALVLSFVVLLLELRRITGFPHRFLGKLVFWEERKQPCGLYLALFIVVPGLALTAYGVLLKKQSMFDHAKQPEGAADFSVLKLSDHSMITEKDHHLETVVPVWLLKPEPYEWTVSNAMLFDLQVMMWLDTTQLLIMLLNFLVMFCLSFRYFLIYFPDMRYITTMIYKAAVPTFIALCMLLSAMLCFTCLFYMIFSDSSHEFRNWLVSSMSVLQFAHGGFANWEALYQNYAYTWYVLIVCSFCVFTLMLNNILIAILCSHFKEAQLHKNYSSHPFWQQAMRTHMMKGGVGEVNPALIGFEFGEKDAKEVTEKPGQQI